LFGGELKCRNGLRAVACWRGKNSPRLQAPLRSPYGEWQCVSHGHSLMVASASEDRPVAMLPTRYRTHHWPKEGINPDLIRAGLSERPPANTHGVMWLSSLVAHHQRQTCEAITMVRSMTPTETPLSGCQLSLQMPPVFHGSNYLSGPVSFPPTTVLSPWPVSHPAKWDRAEPRSGQEPAADGAGSPGHPLPGRRRDIAPGQAAAVDRGLWPVGRCFGGDRNRLLGSCRSTLSLAR
jgi:hypothetical protein